MITASGKYLGSVSSLVVVVCVELTSSWAYHGLMVCFWEARNKHVVCYSPIWSPLGGRDGPLVWYHNIHMDFRILQSYALQIVKLQVMHCLLSMDPHCFDLFWGGMR